MVAAKKSKRGGVRAGAGRKKSIPTIVERSVSSSLKVRKVADAIVDGCIPDLKIQANQARALEVLDLLYEIALSPGMKKAIPVNPVKGLEYPEGTRFLYPLIGQPVTKYHAFYKHFFTWESSYVKGKSSTKYTVLPERLNRLIQMLNSEGLDVPTLRQKAEAAGHSFEVSCDRSEMKTTKSGNRRHAWWVNTAREVRAELFLQTHGIGFDYDLAAAKPSLTLQSWKQLMERHFPNEVRSLPAWERYVANRQAGREALAKDLDISLAAAKDVFQKILNGAVPAAQTSISTVLGAQKTKRLAESELYKTLRADWNTFIKGLRRLNDLGDVAGLGLKGYEIEIVNDEPKKVPVSAGKLCSEFYERLEDEVMGVLQNEITKIMPNLDTWFIHDGFMTKLKLSRSQILEIEESTSFRTGLSVKLDVKDLSSWLQ